MSYHRDLFNQSRVYYTVENNLPVLTSCHAGESFWFGVLKGLFVTIFIVFLMRHGWRKMGNHFILKQNDLPKATKSNHQKTKSEQENKTKPESVIEVSKIQQTTVIDRK